MNISYTPEQVAFRNRVCDWLSENWDYSVDKVPESEEERGEFLRLWDRKLFEAGLAGISWPKEYGGQGLTLVEEMIFNEELGKIDAPEGYMVSKSLFAPTLLVYGTEAQKKRFIPKILTAEEVWCQGFSEPNAGSDLAAVSTKATLQGDQWIINGQKVWTSQAQYADWCFVLARTDQNAKKHQGITFFLVPMDSPGITVRPLVQMTGEREFNEVFFEDVRIPKDSYIGELNEGWKVAMHLFSFERGVYILGLQARTMNQLDQLLRVSQDLELNGEKVLKQSYFRQKLAQIYMEGVILKYHGLKNASKVENGGQIAEEASLHKLYWSELYQRLSELSMEILGERAYTMGQDALSDGFYQYHYLQSRASSIYGGTSQIQKNIIAERILGMPK